MSFIEEIKRRNVLRAATLYAASAWALAQGIAQLLPVFGLDEWITRWFLVAALIGFPLWVAFAWFYEFTPQGLKRESEIDPADSIARRTGRTLDRWIIGVLAVAVVLLLSDRFVLHKTNTPLAERSIAVLPFANTSGDTTNEYFSDGLSEELISSLSRLANLKVIGRTSSFRFKGSTDDSRTIGAALGVGYLLEGSVRKSSDRVRIAVALLKAADGASIWSESYDRELKDIFAVQTEIAAAVAQQLKVALFGDNAEIARASTDAKPSNDSVPAYTALMQASFYANRQTEADHHKAIGYYDEAIRLDPHYALAYAGLAHAWSDLAAIWLGGTEAATAKDKARAAAQMALSLSPKSSLAHLALADIKFQADFDIAGAGEEYRRAVELAPAGVLSKLGLAYWLVARGQHEDAIALIREALALDPLRTEGYVFYARSLVALGRYDEAEATVRKGLELQPDAARLHVVLTEIALLRGQPAQALSEAQREGEGFWRDFAITLATQKQGDAAAADAALHRFIDAWGESGGAQIAIVYALRKEPDEVFAWLDRAYDERDTGALYLPLNDPFLLAYKDDPRFAVFCARVGLPTALVAEQNKH